MGLGDLPLGDGLLGEPLAIFPVPTAPTRPRALWFDPTTRDFKIDSNGRYLDLHPVDAGVTQSMMFALGSLPGAPQIGQSLANAEPGDALEKDVENRVRLAVAWLVNRGDVEIVAIRSEQGTSGAVLAELDYRNLRADPSQIKTATTPRG